MAFGVAGVILFLIPVLTVAQINQDGPVEINFGNARFGFGGVQTMSGILRSLCKEKCPRDGRFLVLNVAKIFCAVNCPENNSNSSEPMMPGNMTMMMGNMTMMMGNMTMMMNVTMPMLPGGSGSMDKKATNTTSEKAR